VKGLHKLHYHQDMANQLANSLWVGQPLYKQDP